MSANDMIK